MEDWAKEEEVAERGLGVAAGVEMAEEGVVEESDKEGNDGRPAVP